MLAEHQFCLKTGNISELPKQQFCSQNKSWMSNYPKTQWLLNIFKFKKLKVDVEFHKFKVHKVSERFEQFVILFLYFAQYFKKQKFYENQK